VGWVAAHRTMMEVPDVFVDPRFLRSATGWWQRHGLTSFVGMPIIQDGHLLGVLSFVSARPLRLGAEEREVLDTLVGQAALAMRNARLFAAAEEREREASALFDITRRLGATLDVDEILDIVAEGTVRAMGSEAAGFLRWDEARQRLVVARAVNYSLELAKSLAIRPGEGVSGRAYAERRVCWTDDPGGGRGPVVRAGDRRRRHLAGGGRRLHGRTGHPARGRVRCAAERAQGRPTPTPRPRRACSPRWPARPPPRSRTRGCSR
jgi:signal transduction protein with GAF and PtsI domain